MHEQFIAFKFNVAENQVDYRRMMMILYYYYYYHYHFSRALKCNDDVAWLRRSL